MYTQAALVALLGCCSTLVSAQLDVLAKAAGLEFFGAALGETTINDAAYLELITNTSNIGQLTPENGQKWSYVEPSRGTFDYESNAETVPRVAEANGQLLRCHALVWHNQLPGWVTSGTWTPEDLTEVIETHIANVAGHFAGRCHHWDVVNEVVDDNGEWRSSPFYDTLGTDFFAISFNAAKAADPDAKLYLNDYNLEYNGAKTDRTVEAVQIILDAGAPIDGVGFQGHLIVGTTPSRADLATVLERFTALGLEVAYTEIDIRFETGLPASEEQLAQQGVDYANTVGSCLDVAGCVGITLWGISDKYSWIPGTFPGTGDALIYDADLQPKPAFTSISSVLAAAAATAAP